MAKFKLKERVKFRTAGGETKAGTISVVDGNTGWYWIKTDDGESFTVEERDIFKNASQSCNAKFKVGDWVKVVKGPSPDIGEGGKVVSADAGVAGSAHGKYAGERLVAFERDGARYIKPESCLVRWNSKTCASANPTVANAMNARTSKNATARNYSRDTESFDVRKKFEAQLGRIVQKFISDITSVGSKVQKEFQRLQKSDPDNAFWVGEVQNWIDGLKGAVDEVW